MDSGMVRGTTGVMLYNGPLFGFDVMAVIVPGNQNLPDPGSAAGIVAPVSKVVPGFKVDTSMLLKEADEIDKRLQQEQSVSVRDDSTQIYG
jgi:predicted ATP-grasp superfamily ATP-dependent carboligase